MQSTQNSNYYNLKMSSNLSPLSSQPLQLDVRPTLIFSTMLPYPSLPIKEEVNVFVE